MKKGVFIQHARTALNRLKIIKSGKIEKNFVDQKSDYCREWKSKKNI